jgi:enoyl-[acyl-carrier protein] reductase I
MATLSGKKGLIVGIANEHSLAYACASHFCAVGAETAITYINAKTEPYVRPLAQALQSEIFMPCDVTAPRPTRSRLRAHRSGLGPPRFRATLYRLRPQGRSERAGHRLFGGGIRHRHECLRSFFLRVAKLSEPLMTAGGCLLAMSYYGAEKAIAYYNVMGTVKAALEAAVRYVALEFGQARIRANALSPGPVKTRAASGIEHFDELLERAVREAPEHRRVTLDDVGAYAAFLVSDAAKAITGNVAYVDAGYHVMA